MKRRDFIKQVSKGFAGLMILPILPFLKLNKPKEWTFNIPKYNQETNIDYINGKPIVHIIEGVEFSQDELRKIYIQKTKLLFDDLPPLCDFWEMPK